MIRFTAPDPWCGGMPTDFTLADAVVSLDNAGLPGRSCVPILRTIPYASNRWVPDSLAELWKTGRVPIEEVPRLLAAIEPGLIRDDYKPVMKLSTAREVGIPAVGMGAAVTGLLFGVLRPNGQVAPVASIAAGLLAGAMIGGFCLGSLRLRQSRRRQQMEWLLSQQTGPSPSQRGFWVRMTGMLVLLVLLIFGCIVAGASYYGE